MALVKTKPTSAGRRSMVKVVNAELHKGAPYAPLVEALHKRAGRNHQGNITTRHQGGGHKHHYRIIDFRRNDKDGIPAKVERIEYDPNRSANIALLCYADGERRYMIAPKGVTVGQRIEAGAEAPIKSGNALPLRNIPVGTTVHCVELLPREGEYAQLRMRSGEIRRVHVNCRATIGEVGNEEHNLRQIGKAGANRWRGIRPTVRGETMNPVDHPLGGRTRGNRHPVSPWGQPAKGKKTRSNKRTQHMIVRSRHKKA